MSQNLKDHRRMNEPINNENIQNAYAEGLADGIEKGLELAALKVEKYQSIFGFVAEDIRKSIKTKTY